MSTSTKCTNSTTPTTTPPKSFKKLQSYLVRLIILDCEIFAGEPPYSHNCLQSEYHHNPFLTQYQYDRLQRQINKLFIRDQGLNECLSAGIAELDLK
jgi:hypothetical protein